MTDEQVREIAERWLVRWTRREGVDAQRAIEFANRTTQPYSGEATPDDMLILADRLESAGNAEDAGLIRAFLDRVKRLDLPMGFFDVDHYRNFRQTE